MSHSSKTSQSFGAVTVAQTTNLNTVRLTRASASQGTSLTSGVTLNSPAGSVFTFTTGTLATAASTLFTVTNSAVRADSLVLGSIQHYNGAGAPVARFTNITQGSFGVHVTNTDLTNAVSGSLRVGFAVL